ncbi:class I SAM-dependent methyltransferase [Patescibacteria group bacterium]|nr:class I SAM-dependent methyltransferase [Patescibacteria group bacterium]
MPPSKYHKQYMAQSDKEIAKKAEIKKKELKKIFSAIKLKMKNKISRIAVLGCGDKRLVAHHKRIFEEILKKSVELITFDITIEHLKGEEGIKKHDCIKPLPNRPYDIVYGHVFLKFLSINKQWAVIKNSYNALKKGGIAIFVFDEEDYKSGKVPLEKWEEKMKKEKIKFLELPLKFKIKTKFLKGMLLALQK